jgi:hypothetical protein
VCVQVKRRLAALHTEEQLKLGVKKPTGPDEAAVAAAAAATVAAQAMIMEEKLLEEGKRENYTIFFHMLMLASVAPLRDSRVRRPSARRRRGSSECVRSVCQDHALPDLIWNQQTRGELRAALDAELREVCGVAPACRLCW